ncbi:MAG TPA: pyridoxal phosphate-dependent aminotransferase, partial [Gaiellaceae bacterium]|nr:pyridoxal phosphate-dependent aminotransferase [Gaiellaceae bacterium]
LGQRQPAPPPRGLRGLRDALASWVARGTGRAPDPETEVLVTNGAMHALGVCFRALLDRGDEVLVPTPSFFFDGPIRAAGGVPVHVPSTAAQHWEWDAEGLARAVGPRTRALLLCNPGNPTGHVAGAEAVESASLLAARHGLVIVTDEAYEAALWEGLHASAFAAASDAVLVRSLGKSLSMPHLRIGLLAGPPHLVERCAVVLEWDVLRVGLAPQAAALAVLDGDDRWLRDVHAGLAADRDVALAAAHQAGLEVVPPRAGPFLFCSSDSPELAAELLACGLPVVDGVHFHAPGWARLPFGGAAAAEAELRAALARWAKR